MPTASIVVESKYGNTAKVAEAIAEGYRSSGAGEAKVVPIREADVEEIAKADIILVGSPNHVGGPMRTVRKFIKALGRNDLTGRSVAFFDTYIGKEFGKALRKMESEMAQRNPGAGMISPGLSLRVESMKGPLAEGELDKGVAFGRTLSERAKRG